MESNLRILNAFKNLKESIEKEKEKTEQNKKNIAIHDEEIDKVLETVQKIIKQAEENKEELKSEITDKIENIKIRVPKDGKDGKNGRDGVDGLDGQDGKDGRDGKNGKDGINGKDGKDGKDGINGVDGVGILDAEINKEGQLILKLTDGRKINVGRVTGRDGIGYRGLQGIGVTNAEIKQGHLIITLSDGKEIDAGHISGGGSGGTSDYEELDNLPSINNVELTGNKTLHELGIQEEGDYALSSEIPTELSELSDDSTHRTVTDAEKTAWNNKSDFSGNYNDLSNKPDIPSKTSDLTNDSGFITKDVNNLTNYTKTSELSNVATSGNYEDLSNKPTIPVVPTNVSAFTNDAGYLIQHQDISGKYDKTGGEISGDVKIDGSLTLDIEDEDYDAGIRFTKVLDDNLGTVLTLTGYANGDEPTSYKPIIRNIGTPNANYDVANKKYVDDNVVQPTLHLVFLNADGTVDTYASTLNYNTIKANMTDPKEADYLDVIWNTTRFYAKCIEVTDVNNGDLKFIADIEYAGIPRRMVFTLNSNSVLTTTSITTGEIVSNKVQDIVSNSTSTEKYPSTKAVFDQFQRKPVVVWQDATGLAAIQADISASPAWQLTGLDLTPYKRVKIYSKAGKGRTDASTTPAMILEMDLDANAVSTAWGNHYIGSVMVQKPNDNNRLATLTCAISSDKTSFVVLRQTSLYGTAATTNADIGANVYKIEGYYD